MRRRDLLGDLESSLFDQLREATDLARRLALLCRMNQATFLQLADARGRESERRLNELLALEHPRERKAAKKGTHGQRAR